MKNLLFTLPLQQNITTEIAEQASSIGQYFGLSGTSLNILGGIIILVIGYFLAKFVGKIISRILHKAGVDKGISSKNSLSQFGGDLVYYLLMIIILMITLNTMGVSSDVLKPLNTMTTKFLSVIPNIVVACIIAYVGYFLAKIVSSLIEAAGGKIRSYLPKLKLDKIGFDVVKIIKSIVFIFIFIPILIIALEKLHVDVITIPATNMLNTFLSTIPLILYATIILLVAIFGGKLLKSLLSEILIGLKVNDLGQKIKLEKVIGTTSLVSIISNIIFIFIVYIGILEACRILGLSEIVNILNSVLVIGGKILFGLIILMIGNMIANLITKTLNINSLLKSILKAVILVIFISMGLSAMGIASNIIELAFGLGLGAIAVAFAIAFGLGGKETAGEELKKFFEKINNKK